MASGFQILGEDGATNLSVEAASKAARTLLYDASGNPIPLKDKSATAGANQRFMPISGLDGGIINRACRVGEYGTQRVTSESLLYHDAFESATINTWWTQALTTMTAVQATGVLTLNNGSITTLNTNAIVTSLKQFPKYPRQPIYARFRALITANVAGNHTLVEMGFGAPAGVTAIINNGAFFRWKADGTLVAVVSYNGTETISATLLAQGVISTANYYYYDVIVDDDFARFIVSDANGTPVVDTQLSIAVTSPFTFAVSHTPSFARVYVDATGGGTVIQLKIAAHTVQMMDALNNAPWEQQLGGTGRQASMSPTTYAQITTLANGAAPGTTTPTNTTATITTLGGEFACAATAASENVLSVFGFTVLSPYSLIVRSIFIPSPVVQGAAVVTVPLLEWFLAYNASSANLSTATGLIRVPLPGFQTTIAAAAIGALFTGESIKWTPQVPICCLPGTFLHIGYKSITGAATASLVYRGQVVVDGYFQ